MFNSLNTWKQKQAIEAKENINYRSLYILNSQVLRQWIPVIIRYKLIIVKLRTPKQ